MRTDYVVTVAYMDGSTPQVYDYRSGWPLARVHAWFTRKFRYQAVRIRVEVAAKPKS